MENSSWLIEKKYKELIEIAQAAMNQEKASRLKSQAFLLMGVYPEFEAQGKKIAKDNAYIRTVLKRVDLKTFLDHNEKKKAEYSKLNKKILYRLWLSTVLTQQDRLRVASY